MKKNNNKSGGALLMAFVVLLAFSVLAIGMFKLHQTDAVEAVYVEQDNQAFWVAEAGAQRVLSKLRKDSGYRQNIIDNNFNSGSARVETGTVGNGTYSALVWGDSSVSNFVIESQGNVQGAARRVQLISSISDIGEFTLIGLGGTLALNGQNDGAPDIDGKIYQDGPVDISDTGNMEATIFSTSEGYENITEDAKIDLQIDSSTYTPYFSIPTVATPSDESIDLSTYGGTLAVNSSIDPTNLVGTGTLIVNGDQTFGKNVTIGSDINIYVSGNLYIDKNASLGDNVHIYVGGSVTVRKENGTVFGTGTGCSLLVKGNLAINKALEFQGLIFAEGKITSDKELTVSGMMIAGNGFDLKKSFGAVFNLGVIPQGIMDNSVSSAYFVQSSEWTEISVD